MSTGNGKMHMLETEESGAFREGRRRASEKFEKLEWPGTSEEEWRRSDISTLGIERYLKNDNAGANDADSRAGPDAFRKGEWSGAIAFTGGTLTDTRLEAGIGAQGVLFSSYSGKIENGNGAVPKIESVFSRGIERIDNRIGALHYTAWDHGAVLYVPPFVEIAQPFLVDFTETGAKLHTAPHLLVYLDTGARARVVLRLRSGERDEILCNSGFDAEVSEGAGLELSVVQSLGKKSTWFNHGTVTIGQSGTYTGFEAVLGAAWSKTRTEAVLTGEGSDAHLLGMYFTDKDRHADIRTVQRHRSPRTASRSFYKGAVKDRGRSVYQGLIEVSPNACGTDAFLTNKNLILSDGARADSIPSLEIKTNDVKCSHGSTTGKIDPEQRFYLQARGLSKREADRLLVEGYFEDVFRHTPEVLHEDLRKAVSKRIG